MAQSKEMISRARQLRHDMTKEERHLWYDFLRAYVPRFTRQKIVEPYILDFYCCAAGLAVELDGGQHYEDAGKVYDERRTAYLQQQGIQVLRFSNLDVIRNFDGVCFEIDAIVRELLARKSGAPASSQTLQALLTRDQLPLWGAFFGLRPHPIKPRPACQNQQAGRGFIAYCVTSITD